MISLKLVGEYAKGLLKDCERLGFDGIVVSEGEGHIGVENIPPALEFVDRICLFAFRIKDASVVFNIVNEEKFICLLALVAVEDIGIIPEEASSLLYESIKGTTHSAWERLVVRSDDDSISINLKLDRGGQET